MKKLLIGLGLLGILINYTSCLLLDITTTAVTSAALIEERSVGNIIDDNVDVNSIRIKLYKQGRIFKNVHVEVFEGRVLLTGKVGTEELKLKIEESIWKIPRVSEIINELIIDNTFSLKASEEMNDYMKDSWILSKVRSKILFSSRVKALNYRAAVYRGNVYLIGLAQDQKEIEGILRVVSSVRDIEKLHSFIILTGDIRRDRALM